MINVIKEEMMELCYICKKKPKVIEAVCKDCNRKIDDSFDRMHEKAEKEYEKFRCIRIPPRK